MNFRMVTACLAVVFSVLVGQRAAGQAVATPPPAAAQASPSRSLAPADQTYVLGASDVVEVSVLTHPDYTTRDRVGADGAIQLPYLGSVKAAGKTGPQLEADVAQALDKGGYFAHPVVKVDIVSFGSRYVTVLGEFQSPGLVPVDRAYRLSEILARVGGVKEGGADYLILTPANGQAEKLPIKDIATGGLAEDPYVQAGDKIYSPQAELFYVSGQVNAPGAFPVIPGLTLRMAIARAGGVTMVGSEKKLKLTRHGVRVAHFDLNDPVQAGDVLVVGQSLFAF
jgi:polysaccharide export outer membrane protein